MVTLSKKQELSDKLLYVPSAMFTVRAQCGRVVGWSVISIGDGDSVSLLFVVLYVAVKANLVLQL